MVVIKNNKKLAVTMNNTPTPIRAKRSIMFSILYHPLIKINAFYKQKKPLFGFFCLAGMIPP